MMKPFCKKCLLSEMDENSFFENISDYISSIPKEMKTDDITYKSRLNACKSCSCLINGMCNLCGCFVEVRAIKAKMYCPNEDKKW